MRRCKIKFSDDGTEIRVLDRSNNFLGKIVHGKLYLVSKRGGELLEFNIESIEHLKQKQ